MNKDIIVIGGGGHSKVIISMLKKCKDYKIIGYADNSDKGLLLTIPYIGNDDYVFQNYHSSKLNIAIGIGLISNFSSRLNAIKNYIEYDFVFPKIISINSIINEDIIIEDGTVIMDGVVVNSGTTIDKYSILNTKCSVDHDCKIGSNVHIAPGVTLSGDVTIKDNVLIGTGTSIIQGITICDNVTIGAGSVVTKNISEPGTYVGIPAKRMK